MTMGVGAVAGFWKLWKCKEYFKYAHFGVLNTFLVSYVLSTVLNMKYGIMDNLQGFIWLAAQVWILYLVNVDVKIEDIKQEFKILGLIYVIFVSIANIVSLGMFLLGYTYRNLETGKKLGFLWGRLWGVYDDPNHGSIISMIAVVLAVYLSIPVLACIKENSSLLKYMLLCGVITYSVFPVLGDLIGIPFNSGLSFPMTGGYVLYAILGYVLSTEDMSKKQRYIVYINAILCVLLRYFSTIIVSVRTGELYKEFWGYMNFPAVGLAVGVFVLFKYAKWDSIFSNLTRINIVTSIASASFGIYLIHMIVINAFYVYGVNVYGLKWRVIGPILVYIISLAAVKCMQSIPGVKRIIP